MEAPGLVRLELLISSAEVAWAVATQARRYRSRNDVLSPRSPKRTDVTGITAVSIETTSQGLAMPIVIAAIIMEAICVMQPLMLLWTEISAHGRVIASDAVLGTRRAPSTNATVACCVD